MFRVLVGFHEDNPASLHVVSPQSGYDAKNGYIEMLRPLDSLILMHRVHSKL
jgi:hypothetical protein